MAQFLLLMVAAFTLLALESENKTRTWLRRGMGVALLRHVPTPHHALYREPCERGRPPEAYRFMVLRIARPRDGSRMRRERVWRHDRRDLVSVHP